MSNPIPQDEGPDEQDPASPPPTTIALTAPPWARLCWMLSRWNNRRFGYRLIQSAALSLALSQSALCLLNNSFGPNAYVAAHLIVTTLLWTMGLLVFTSFFLVRGFLEPQTLRFLDELLSRRGHSRALSQTLETRATAMWLGLLAGLPLTITSTVALIRVHSRSEFFFLARTSGLSLCVAELFMLLVLGTLLGLRKLELTRPRQLLLLVILGPELLRVLDPSLPTLYTLAARTSALIVRWSDWS